MLSDFLDGARAAVVVEDGAIAFDLAEAKYSVSGEYNKCLLHLWSSERNFVRRVLDAEVKATTLRLQVQHMGQNRPTRLDFCRDRDQRSPAARRAARVAYEPRLRRALERNFPEWSVVRLTTSVDLEHSFGPAYLRGWLRQGQRALAIVGVNDQETQSTVDGALTCGILWLEACRLAQQERRVVEGLAMVVPKGTVALTRQRMAHLHPTEAKWHLYEFDQGEDAIVPVDTGDRGNLATRLVHSIDEGLAEFCRNPKPWCSRPHRFHSGGMASNSPRRGLRMIREISRAASKSFSVWGRKSAFSTRRTKRSLAIWCGWRRPYVTRTVRRTMRCGECIPSAGWNRWWSATSRRSDGRLQPESVYAQVPAFAAADRARIDILAATREGRLAVIELKADEDIHLPVQGVDYWSRAGWHQSRGEFAQFGYFPGHEISPQKPLLMLVAPALQVHPTTDTILRYLSPEIDWEVLGIDECCGEEIRVVFRKRPVRPPVRAA
jgi:hypothetical protein